MLHVGALNSARRFSPRVEALPVESEDGPRPFVASAFDFDLGCRDWKMASRTGLSTAKSVEGPESQVAGQDTRLNHL